MIAKRLLLCSCLFCLGALPMHADPVALTIAKGPALHEITLSWTGGVLVYRVYRSTQENSVVSPGTLVTKTTGQQWVETTPFADIWYYQVMSPTPCTQGNECGSGFCADDVCCDSTCGGTCQACDGPTPGACASVITGTDPENECSGAKVCDGQGACVTVVLPDASVPGNGSQYSNPANAYDGSGATFALATVNPGTQKSEYYTLPGTAQGVSGYWWIDSLRGDDHGDPAEQGLYYSVNGGMTYVKFDVSDPLRTIKTSPIITGDRDNSQGKEIRFRAVTKKEPTDFFVPVEGRIYQIKWFEVLP
jgi:hypothetical protein